MKRKFLAIICIFLFSVIIRLWNLNLMGETADETAQNIDGYHMVSLLTKKDFNNKYFYDRPYHPPLTKYVYGLASYIDVESWKLHPNPYWENLPEPTFRYDFTYSRLISVLFSSLTVVIVLLTGWRFISPFVGVVASLILSTFPLFVGYSQLVTIESLLVFFFTYSIYAFLKFLEKNSVKNLLFCGILIGLALLTKYTNILLIPLIVWIFLMWHFNINNGSKNNLIRNLLKILTIFFIAFLVFVALWPMPWFHLKEVLELNYQLRIAGASQSVPGVFFGKLILVPKVYYLVFFLITTPLIILLLFFAGLLLIMRKGTGRLSLRFYIKEWTDNTFRINRAYANKTILERIWIPLKKFFFFYNDNIKTLTINNKKKLFFLHVLVIWFAFPFIQSLYNFRTHGIRYIIEIYAPLALISAVGFEAIVNKLTKNMVIKLALCLLLLSYMLIVLLRITPYYLDYYNAVVGGAKGVYEKRMFELGWWGQGLREMSVYFNTHVKKESSVGLAVWPSISIAPMPGLKTSVYDPKKSYDYVAVSYFNIVREGFDDSSVIQNYKLIHSVMADGAEIVKIYKHK
jgi:4-amino-4-deoxy-L-arabinose transferase-like glycosyltransferase